MATKITTVNHVVNTFLKELIWRSTSTQFTKLTNITNVNPVVNHFLWQALWSYIAMKFMKAAKTTNVDLVVNHFLEQNIWRDISVQCSSWRPQRLKMWIMWWQIIFSSRKFEGTQTSDSYNKINMSTSCADWKYVVVGNQNWTFLIL